MPIQIHVDTPKFMAGTLCENGSWLCCAPLLQWWCQLYCPQMAARAWTQHGWVVTLEENPPNPKGAYQIMKEPKKLFNACITHEYGTTFFSSTSPQGLYCLIASEYCTLHSKDAADQYAFNNATSPEAKIHAYFDDHLSESCHIGESELHL